MNLATQLVLIGTIASDHGTTPPPPVDLIATFTLENTSGAIQPIGCCDHMRGHPFVEGDLPSGEYPIFKTAIGGTIVPYSITVDNKAWPDGSMEHAGFVFRLPVAIAASGSLDIEMYSGGTAPASSSRSLTDFATGGLDLNVFVTGQDNLSGDWTFNLNQGIAAAHSDNILYADGEAGKYWDILTKARQSGANHGQLEGLWCVGALDDASGNLGGIRYFCRVWQPLYNVASPAPQYRSFSAFKVRNGTTVLRDIMTTLPAAKTFTWSGSGKILNSSANGFEGGIACKLSTTGTLPAGLDTTTIYCVATDVRNDPDVFGLADTFAAPAVDSADPTSGACITPTTSGSGTHTATMYPMVSQFGSLCIAETDGRYSYIQGAGSIATDSTLNYVVDMEYWCRTKTLPPFDLNSYSVASNPTYTYFPGTSGPLTRGTQTTGERNEIAQINTWYARHALNQSAVDEQAVRVIGLIGLHPPAALYDSVTRSIPVANNGSYSGMPAANNSFRWYGTGNNVSGFTPPSNTNVISQGWAQISSDHWNGFAYYPFLLNAESQFKRSLAEYGNLGLYQGYTGTGTALVNGSVNRIGFIRNGTINGVTRAGIFYGEDGARSVAWAFRDIGSTGIANFHNPSWNDYFDDIVSDCFDGWADYRSMLAASGPAYATAHGLWSEEAGNGLESTFQLSYLIGAICLVTGIRKSTAGLTFLTYLTTWPAYVSNTFSPYLVSTYRTIVRQGLDEAPYAASDAPISMYNANLSWSSSGSLFTISTLPNGCTLNNGDKFVWNNAPSDGSPPPTGMSGWTPYYAVNKSGSNFQLSATVGGSPISLSNNSGVALVFYLPSAPPATGSIDTIIGSGYVASMVATCGWANAIGATVDATFLTALTARLTGTAGYAAAFEADPKYAIRSTYL